MKKAILCAGVMAVLCACVFAGNEISVNINLLANKGYNKVERAPGSQLINWNSSIGGAKYMADIVLTNAYQVFSKGAVSNMGYCYIRNVNTNSAYTNQSALYEGYKTTNTALLSFDGGTNWIIYLHPGENAIFRFNPSLGTTLVGGRAYSNQNVRLEWLILED